MDKPTRLFDLLTYRKSTKPDRAVLVAKRDGEWKKIFIDEYIDNVDAVSCAFLHLGIKKGDNVALISSDRPEWNYVDLGVQQTGAVLVPIYPTISEDDYRYILKDCEVQYLVLENDTMYRKVQNVLPELTTLKGVYFIDPKEGDTQHGTFAQLVQLGRDNADMQRLSAVRDAIQPRDVTTMIYTSGTTGAPKGVMLCHENILTCVYGVQHTPKPYFSRAMSFLPLCHVYERMMNYFYQYMGYETYYAENVGKVVENLKVAKPHIMTAVPRFIEKMYEGISRKAQKMKGPKKQVFLWALRLATRYDLEGTTWWYKIRRQWANLWVYGQIRESFGGHLEMLVSGGSAIHPRLARFFTCIGINIYEGYGLTETAPVISVSSSAPNGRKIGTAGLPLPGIEVRVVPGTDEIVCRGPNVMLGYYRQPELTAKAIDADGWFHTGDTGMFTPKGQLCITGRTNTIFKTSMGKFVNPEAIEAKIKESPLVQDVMVVGENQKFAAALIIPDFQNLQSGKKRRKKRQQDPAQLISDRKIIAHYARIVDKCNKQLGATEQIKRFKLINDHWDTSNGCLTPTLKLKRAVIVQRCQKQIEELFK